MRVRLKKDASSKSGNILAHVEVSESDDSTKWKYSHSFRFVVPRRAPLDAEGEIESTNPRGDIIVYSDKDAASGNKDGTSKDGTYSFDREML